MQYGPFPPDSLSSNERTYFAGVLQSYKQQASKLAGQIALLKSYSTRSAQQTAQDAVQIFGGRGITQSGMGGEIEHVRLSCWMREICVGADWYYSIIGPSPSTRCWVEARMSWPILVFDKLSKVCPRTPSCSLQRGRGDFIISFPSVYIICLFSARVTIIYTIYGSLLSSRLWWVGIRVDHCRSLGENRSEPRMSLAVVFLTLRFLSPSSHYSSVIARCGNPPFDRCGTHSPVASRELIP